MTQPVRSARQLGVLIREERRRRGMTQQQLAGRSGTGQKTISQIENGNEGASLETVFHLLGVLWLEIRFAPRDIGIGTSVGDVF